MNRLLLLTSLLLLSAPLAAVELYDQKCVERVEIVVDSRDPTAHYDSAALAERLKTRAGGSFSQLYFDEDLKTLSKDFDKVQPSIQMDGDKLIIVIHVAPRPLVHKIVFRGNERISTGTLQDELDVEPGGLFNRSEFNKSLSKVKEYYIKKGYFEASMTYTLEPVPDSDQVDVVIQVSEGRSGKVQQIDFVGFTKEEEAELTSQMFLKRYNFLISWLTGDGIYKDEQLEQDRITILGYLQNEGYADASVDIQLTEDPETGKLIVTITAERGQLYHFGPVKIEGNILFPSDELCPHLLIRENEVYSPDKLRETANALKEVYGAKGYIDASVQYDAQVDPKKPIISVTFFVDEGEQYKIGLIHVIGNHSTQYNVILRESLLVPGETFDSRKLKATQMRLEGVGYFKSVNVYAVRTADDEALGSNYRDVYIEVEETSTGNVSLFVGASTTDNVFGGIDLMERNFNIAGVVKAVKGNISALRGGGQFFQLRGTLGQKESNTLLTWVNPYVYDSLWRFGFELSQTFSHLQSKHIGEYTYGGSIFSNYPLTQYWTFGLRERMRHVKSSAEISPPDQAPSSGNYAEQVRKSLDQRGFLSAVSTNLAYDSTDSAQKPHKGWRSYFELEVAGVGGQFDFFKTSYLNSIYIPVAKKTTIKLRGEYRTILPFGRTNRSTVPYTERLFLGGDQSVRGYKPYIIGPLVEVQNDVGQIERTNTPLGGNSSLLLSAEISQELLRPLDFFAYFDAGAVTTKPWYANTLRAAAGVGIRLDIGKGIPIMVGYGIPINPKNRHQDSQKFFFSMAGQF